MALTFVVLSGNPSEHVPLTLDGPRIVVGRAEGADLRLPDLSVSARHASFRQRGGEYLIVDEDSTNGTFVGPVRLSPQAPRVIRSGDKVRFGRLWVAVHLEAVPNATQSKHAARDLALMLTAEALAAGEEPLQVSLEVAEGPDQGLKLALEVEEYRYTIGRSSANELTLAEGNASRRHAEVFRRQGRVYTRDLGSKNGTLLAQVPLSSKSETQWQPGAKLQIGRDLLILNDPVPAALAEIETAADEVMSPDEEVRTPRSEEPTHTLQRREEERAERQPSQQIQRKSGMSGGDWLVALIAIVVIGVSLFGLYWVLGRH